MKIKVLNEISINGKPSNLFNYQYVANDGSSLSAVFQATRQTLENMRNSNIELCHFIDSL